MGTSASDLFEDVHRLDEEVQERVAAISARLADTLATINGSDAANRFKDAVLPVLSEELRKPLTAVLGYAHLLKTGRLSEERARCAAETIERNAIIVDRIVGGLAGMCGDREITAG